MKKSSPQPNGRSRRSPISPNCRTKNRKRIWNRKTFLACKKETRAGLVLADGEPHLLLADENEKPRVYLSLFQGEPTLELSDKDGKTRAALGYTDLKNKRTGSVEKRSASSLVLFGEDGKVIWQAP